MSFFNLNHRGTVPLSIRILRKVCHRICMILFLRCHRNKQISQKAIIFNFPFLQPSSDTMLRNQDACRLGQISLNLIINCECLFASCYLCYLSQLMKMFEGMLESAYELSLSDLVEQKAAMQKRSNEEVQTEKHKLEERSSGKQDKRKTSGNI